MPPETKKKLAEKYETPEELEQAYLELQKTLGKHGSDLDTLRKQAQEAQTTLQEYAQWVGKAQPIVDWYVKNQEEVAKLWATRQNGGNGVQRQAQEIAAQTPGYQWLSPEEQQRFLRETAQHLQDQVVGPWTQKFSQAAEDYAKKAQEALGNQMAAFTNVMWRSLEHVVPPEKMQSLKQWQEKALNFADPSKIDPMKLAQDWLGLSSEVESLKTQLADRDKRLETQTRAEVPSLLNGAPPALSGEQQEPPKSRDERFQRVMDDTQKNVGPEAMREMFPSLGGR